MLFAKARFADTKLATSAILALSLIATACDLGGLDLKPPPSTALDVSGRVTDFDSNEPFRGIEITLASNFGSWWLPDYREVASTTTDSNGVFSGLRHEAWCDLGGWASDYALFCDFPIEEYYHPYETWRVSCQSQPQFLELTLCPRTAARDTMFFQLRCTDADPSTGSYTRLQAGDYVETKRMVVR